MKAARLETILEMASLLGEQTEYEDILKLVTKKAAVLVPSDVALVMMINPSTRDTIKTIYREGKEEEINPYQLLHTYVSGWVIEHRKGILSNDLANDPRIRTELFRDVPARAVICVPFRLRASVVGTLLLLNKTGEREYQREDISILEDFAAVCAPYLLNSNTLYSYFQSPPDYKSLREKYASLGLLGRSGPFLELLQSIEAAASSDVRVLLEGETGTGKELVARSIHSRSLRASKRYLAIDCGAISAEIIESELFGHTRGAFTGASEKRRGLMEQANGGTLFLDEINNLSLQVQVKLLRAIQEKEIKAVGSDEYRKIDVRIIAAAGTPLRELVDQGIFREDLYYRLYVFPINIPNLRQRREDISFLADHFLEKYNREQKKNLHSISPEVLACLEQHPWKGNIRELENLVERLVTLSGPEEKVLDMQILPSEFRTITEYQPTEETKKESPTKLNDILATHEKEVLETALGNHGWNQSAAARALGISEHTIRYKMKKLGLTRQF